MHLVSKWVPFVTCCNFNILSTDFHTFWPTYRVVAVRESSNEVYITAAPCENFITNLSIFAVALIRAKCDKMFPLDTILASNR